MCFILHFTLKPWVDINNNLGCLLLLFIMYYVFEEGKMDFIEQLGVIKQAVKV